MSVDSRPSSANRPNHKPSKISQALIQRGEDKFFVAGNNHGCDKSPTGSHWWYIKSPGGAMSTGFCRYCGEQRQFANSLEALFCAKVK